MTHRRALVLFLPAVLLVRPAGADALILVSAAEYERELAHQRSLPADVLNEPPLVTRSVYPAIRIVSPRSGAEGVKAPLRLELAFDSGPSARIVPDSFRVLYGMLKLDITERIRRHAEVTERGVVAENAALPAGSHRMYMQVADDRGRFVEREFRFRVES